jgi:hypothetical protein
MLRLHFNMNFNATFAMTHFLKLCYNVFIPENKIDTNVQKNLYQFVIYHVGNCVNLLQYEEGFLLLYPIQSSINTKLTIHALDQVHCWDAYFHLRIGHYENFTLLNFQPLLFSKQ